LVKWCFKPEKIQIITLAASVAVVEAIRNELGIICGIKWPNDIILKGCKVGGILTELSAEPGYINYLVIGIGINANQEICNFNKEIQQKAISLKMCSGKKINRSGLLTCILQNLDNVYKEIRAGNSEKVIDRWKEHSVTIGKSVKFTFSGNEYVGIARTIAEDGKLIVECNDGQMREISAGEIQVRGLLGYT
jgi:BirA family biotin operon repressor/biotin-[acetyl-CoA-carboxylase] ligase